MQNSPVVDVVLCTYNGEKFVGTFLDSLIRQRNVRVHLYVSDDLSEDATCEIVTSYSNRFEVLELVINSKRLGPKRNFFGTLKMTKSNLIAFADQDDIWHDEKLCMLERKFRAGDDVVAAYSNFYSFKSSNMSKIKHHETSSHDLANSIWRNKIPGCTLMLNRNVVSLLCKVNPEKVIMHDWASIILAHSIGKIAKVSEGLVRYRIHSQNFIGIPTMLTKFSRLLLEILRVKPHADICGQAEELHRVLVDDGRENTSYIFRELASLSSNSMWDRIRFCFEHRINDSRKLNLFIFIRVLTRTF